MPCAGQPRDPPRDHAGLAAARSGQHEQRPAGVGDRLALCLVQTREQPFRHRTDGNPGLCRPPRTIVRHRAARAHGKRARCGLARALPPRRGAACARCSAAIPPTVRPRGRVPTRGAGGDRTLVIDSAAEDVVFAELEALHAAGVTTSRRSPRSAATVAFGDGVERGARRDRPDRRLAERQAADPDLFAQHRRRGRRHDGGRRVRLTSTTSGPGEEFTARRDGRAPR